MGEAVKKDITNTEKKSENKEEINKVLDKRNSAELILAFAGPIGCGISLAVKESQRILEAIGYEVHVIKLSKFIENSLANGDINLDLTKYENTSEKTVRILKLQDGGNELRKKEGSILAACAMQDIALQRGIQAKNSDFEGTLADYVPKRTAYLIDQIKHPDEVSMLRKVYGNLFHLIGVISVFEKRKSRLTTSDKIDPSDISMLVERDRRQEDSNGQQLDKALQMADFFVSNDQGTVPSLNRKLKRFLNLLHNENGVTPTAQEYGMYVAYAAGLKSACLSRQVGASISDFSGKIVSTGCNDVPKAMGGLYTSEDQAKDRRCVHREEQICFNDREKDTLKEDIGKTLKMLTKKDSNDLLIAGEEELNKILETIYEASHIKDLIEFSRAVHAEMDAIISLARSGTPGIAGATLYTTTFPCHSCARHIVAAGIAKVYYIEPYEKSLAQKLHDDAIAFEAEDDDPEKENTNLASGSNLVKFIHFEGVSPRQYLNFFKMTKRKDGSGRVIPILSSNAPKAVGEYLDDYRTFEAKVIEHLNQTLPAAKIAV